MSSRREYAVANMEGKFSFTFVRYTITIIVQQIRRLAAGVRHARWERKMT
jgi:hypothetical protein